LKPTKCALLQQEVKYLGNAVGRVTVAMDSEKVPAVKEWTFPRDLHELPVFLGLVMYHKQ